MKHRGDVNVEENQINILRKKENYQAVHFSIEKAKANFTSRRKVILTPQLALISSVRNLSEHVEGQICGWVGAGADNEQNRGRFYQVFVAILTLFYNLILIAF